MEFAPAFRKKNILLRKAKFFKIRFTLSIMLSGKISNYNTKSAPLLLCALGRGPRGPALATTLGLMKGMVYWLGKVRLGKFRLVLFAI
jgi:hypothetical protein